jgi:hypothetical protein
MVITRIMGFSYEEKWQSFKYLGNPLCIFPLSSTSWIPILDKIKSKFTQWGVNWLNPSRCIILINYVLSALPIFKFSALLAPTSFKLAFTHEIQFFLWQGGKYNSKKFQLISWDIVRTPKSHGGLGVMDPSLMKKDLGDKILCILVTK